MFKRKRVRSEAYLAWVRTKPCMVCGAPSEAHHIIGTGAFGGMGMKPSDYLTMPLCREHHDALHETPDDWHLQWQWVVKTLDDAFQEGILEI